MLAVSSSYRMRRLTAFLDPWADPFNSGFQLTQSLIAIGRGQWFGVGLGDSVQKLFYLPEAHTDFLFAVLAEELGLVGVVLTLALFLALVWRSFHIARLAAAGGPEVPGLPRRGLWPVDRHPGVHQHRREHGRAADQGPDAAADELRALEPHRGARLGRTAAARVSRGDAPAARLGDRAGRRMSRPILIMAGGTGGHVFPALALARLLREQSLEVVWLGTERGLESRVIPAEGIPIEWLSVGGLRGKGLLAWLAAPFRLARALLQALSVMRRHRPSVVVGLGGFVTGPGGVAAWLTRRPLVIHEQNAVAGFTNRCLAPLARQVLEAFPGSFGRDVHAQVIGNPVRRDISAVPPPAARFAGRSGPIRILVIGGSQGAARLNAVVPFALKRLSGVARPSTCATRPASAGSRLAGPSTRRPACAPTCGPSSRT